MKVYVICPTYNKRVYLKRQITHREELPMIFTLKCPFEGINHTYNRERAIAEPEKGPLIGGAILGGLVGLLGGPIGLIAGGVIGTLLGDKVERDDINKTTNF